MMGQKQRNNFPSGTIKYNYYYFEATWIFFHEKNVIHELMVQHVLDLHYYFMVQYHLEINGLQVATHTFLSQIQFCLKLLLNTITSRYCHQILLKLKTVNRFRNCFVV